MAFAVTVGLRPAIRPRGWTSELQAAEMRANVPVRARRGPRGDRPNCARLRPTQQSRLNLPPLSSSSELTAWWKQPSASWPPP